MKDRPLDHQPAAEPAPEKRKRGRPAGKKVAASRITGGPGKSPRSVGVLVRFPEADFRRIAAEARSKTASEPDVVRQLVRRGWDFQEISSELRDLRAVLRKVEAELDGARIRDVSERLWSLEDAVEEIRSGTGPTARALAQAVVEAIVEHDAKVRAENP